MLGQWAMTGFAVYLRVHAALLHLLNVGVAGLTCLMSGEMDRASANFRDGVSPVVSVFSKTFRHKKAAYAQKGQCADCIQRGQSEKMS